MLRDDPLDRWYQLGNVIAIVDALLPEQLSPQADYVLASECANAGLVLLSRSQLAKPDRCEAAVAHLKRALTACKCSPGVPAGGDPGERLGRPHGSGHGPDRPGCGLRQASCEKLHFEEHEAFSSAYFLELGCPCPGWNGTSPGLVHRPGLRRVLRVKGFVEENGQWVELNATADGLTASPLAQGQQVLIVIGEGLDKAAIEQKLRN